MDDVTFELIDLIKRRYLIIGSITRLAEKRPRHAPGRDDASEEPSNDELRQRNPSLDRHDAQSGGAKDHDTVSQGQSGCWQDQGGHRRDYRPAIRRPQDLTQRHGSEFHQTWTLGGRDN